LPFGISNHHKPHPGVLSLSPASYQTVIGEVVTCLAESGFRRIALINAHGGNQEANAVVAREARNRLGVSVAAASYWALARSRMAAAGRAGEHVNIPGHAGQFETSLLLAIDSKLVRKSAIPAGKPHRDTSMMHGAAVYMAGKRQGDTSGFSDEPALACEADGAAYVDIIVGALAQFLIEFHGSHRA
jgi:creatinine amidohydrolase